MAGTSKGVSILSMPGTHPAVDQNIRNLAQQLSELSSNVASFTGSQVTQAELTALQNQINKIEAELSTLESEIASALPIYTALEAINAFLPVYAANNGIADLADSSDPSTSQTVIGISTSQTKPGAVISIAGNGRTVRSTTWAWTPNQPVFLGPPGNSLTQTAPNVFQPVIVGIAISATVIYVCPQFYDVPASLSNIPSSAIVFIPSAYNLLPIESGGLRVDGGLVLNGGLKMV